MYGNEQTITAAPQLRTSRLALPALPTSPKLARHHSNEVLAAWNLTEEQIGTAELLISELVTNAVKYAAKPNGECTDSAQAESQQVVLVLYRYPDRLLVEVADENEQLPVRAAPNLDTENGRGLSIVELLSEQWGAYRPPTGGKVVWFEVDLVEPLHVAAEGTDQLTPATCPSYA